MIAGLGVELEILTGGAFLRGEFSNVQGGVNLGRGGSSLHGELPVECSGESGFLSESLGQILRLDSPHAKIENHRVVHRERVDKITTRAEVIGIDGQRHRTLQQRLACSLANRLDRRGGNVAGCQGELHRNGQVVLDEGRLGQFDPSAAVTSLEASRKPIAGYRTDPIVDLDAEVSLVVRDAADTLPCSLHRSAPDRRCGVESELIEAGCHVFHTSLRLCRVSVRPSVGNGSLPNNPVLSAAGLEVGDVRFIPLEKYVSLQPVDLQVTDAGAVSRHVAISLRLVVGSVNFSLKGEAAAETRQLWPGKSGKRTGISQRGVEGRAEGCAQDGAPILGKTALSLCLEFVFSLAQQQLGQRQGSPG